MGNDKNSGEPNESKYGDATFVSLPLLKISTGKPLPGAIFLCLGHRMVRYRSKDDPIEPAEYDKLVFNRVRYIFFDEVDRMAFDRWVKNTEAADTALEPAVAANAEAAPIAQAAMDQRRAIMDIFSNPKDDKQVAAAVDVSKRVVTEFMRKPFAINNIQQLQRYAKGAVDHSVNVSMLCVFLGLRMGYSHQVILENLALGGLFHDIGKVLIETRSDGGLTGSDDPEMQKHPVLGRDFLDANKEIPNEVKLMVAQHHEFLDGSGYPNKLKGLAVYDLARLVAIANTYDNLISESKLNTIAERCSEAIEKLERDFESKLDAKKLEKAVKILRYSFL